MPDTLSDQTAGEAPNPATDPSALRRGRRAADERINRLTSVPFILVHLLPLLAVVTGVTVKAVVLCVVLFYGRMFFITAGFHRYFAHRSYKMGRAAQFVMAFGGGTAAQKGALWWAAHHRDHHRWSDTDEDVHSPQKGFWWSHLGWILCDKYAGTDYDRIRDFAKFPELRWLNKWNFVPPWALGVLCWLIAGWSGLLVGFFLSTVLLWHATFTVNSMAHVFGRRRYATEDTSRNSVLIVLWTMGEGWHNNHHHFQASARQGFFWWEIDFSWYVLRVLAALHIVRDLKVPSAAVLAANRIDRGSFDIGMFRSHWLKASGAVQLAQASIGQRVHDRRLDAADALSARRAALEGNLAAKKESLEDFVLHSLESAEELATMTRKGERELGLADG
jgi:stearoyl-CoA desaturase (Delta-9 desaturase)